MTEVIKRRDVIVTDRPVKVYTDPNIAVHRGTDARIFLERFLSKDSVEPVSVLEPSDTSPLIVFIDSAETIGRVADHVRGRENVIFICFDATIYFAKKKIACSDRNFYAYNEGAFLYSILDNVILRMAQL